MKALDEREGRQEEVPEMPCEPLAVPGGREPPELQREDDQEQDADPERGRGERQRDQAAHQLVRPAVAVGGRHDGQRHGDQDGRAACCRRPGRASPPSGAAADR